MAIGLRDDVERKCIVYGRIVALDANGFNWEAEASLPVSSREMPRDFFDELQAYKEKHGHLNVLEKQDASLHNFGKRLRQARKERAASIRLDNTHWNTRVKFNTKQSDIQPLRQDCSIIHQMDKFGEVERVKPSNPKVNKTKQKPNTQFFDRVEELKAYKEKHGHLIVRQKEDKTLYNFCVNMRQARKGRGGLQAR